MASNLPQDYWRREDAARQRLNPTRSERTPERGQAREQELTECLS